MLLKVGDRVQNRSGWSGSVVEVLGAGARVEFDNGQPSDWFGRDEHLIDGGVLKLI